MLPGNSQGQGPSNQTSALGMNSLHLGSGSPIMNRMEGGGEPGAERNTGAAGNSPTGTAMQANAQQAAVGMGTAMQTPAQNLVAAGSSVGSGTHILPAQNVFGSYGPMRGGLMDPRNYGQNQRYLGGQGHGCGSCNACQGYPGQGLHGQGLFGQGQFGQGQGGQGLTGQGLGCQDKVAWELHAKMPKLAQAEVKNQVRGMQVMGCHGCQVNAEVLHVKDRLGQDAYGQRVDSALNY